MISRTLGIALVSILLAGIAVPCAAQTASQGDYPIIIGSMYGVVSGRSSALGESQAASLGDPSAWNSNPATVAGTIGAGASYLFGHRGLEASFISTDWRGGGVWLATPVVNVAIHAQQMDLGRFVQTFEQGLQGGEFDAHNETVALTLATELASPVAFGASIKWTHDRTGYLFPTSDEPGVAEASGLYVDLGAIGAFPGLISSGALRDSVHVGAALQDIGGRFTYEALGQSAPVAQWLRVGAEYRVAVGNAISTPFRAALSGEYSTRINPGDGPKGDYGGIGLEATAFDIVSLRLGHRFMPKRLSASEPKPWTTFGAGINLPLGKIGLDIPITIGADFAKLPERDMDIEEEKSDAMIELRAVYTGALFKK